MNRYSLIILLVCVSLLSSISPAFAAFTDIEGNWARDAIVRLEELGAFSGLYDQLFQPNDHVSREELIEMTARVFNLTATDKQTLYTWLDHLMPIDENVDYAGDTLTRAELVALIANVLNLNDHNIQVDELSQSFLDITPEHPAFVAVELLNRLGILPTYIAHNFEPNRLPSRAEVASLLDAAWSLKLVEGKITKVEPTIQRIIVEDDQDAVTSLPIDKDTLVFRNGHKITLDQLAIGENVAAIYDHNGTVGIVTVSGSPIAQNILDGVSNLAKELRKILTPEQVTALIKGDLSVLNEGVRANLYERLTDLGLSPWEAEALLTQNWQSLSEMGKDRLAFLLSDYSGITPELFYAAFNQNWERLLEYVQVEIAQRLLSGVLF